MSTRKIPVNRTHVGLIAIGCLLAAVASYYWRMRGGENADLWLGAFVRIGLLMAAFWLALPQRENDPAWTGVSPWAFVGFILALVLVATRPRVAVPFIIVIAVIGYFLRPPRSKRPDPRHYG